MHELSVALEICRLASERLQPAELPLLVTVGVEVGTDAGLEPANLAFCLDAVLAQPPFAGARAVIATPPGDALRLTYLEIDDGRSDD
jgi:Zn finger protein HypA/HybF involved in hydrogenase expression